MPAPSSRGRPPTHATALATSIELNRLCRRVWGLAAARRRGVKGYRDAEYGQRLTDVPIAGNPWSVLVTGDRPCHGARNMELLTVQEVADTMKVSEKTVRRLIKRGDLAAYKVGDRGQLRVKERDLEQYFEAQRVRVEETPQANAEAAE